MSSDDSNVAKWYVLRILPGREKLIVRQIDVLRAKPEFEGVIRDVLIPTQPVIKVKKGKRVTHDKNIFSGYVMVNVCMSKGVMGVLGSISGVSGFIANNGLPLSLGDGEVERMINDLQNKAKEANDVATFDVGQRVKIVEGPFESFVGEVESVDCEKKKLRLAVAIFGRSTPLELEWSQVSVVDSE